MLVFNRFAQGGTHTLFQQHPAYPVSSQGASSVKDSVLFGSVEQPFQPWSNFKASLGDQVETSYRGQPLENPKAPQELAVLEQRYPGSLSKVAHMESLSGMLGFGLSYPIQDESSPGISSTRQKIEERLAGLSKNHPQLLSTSIEDYDVQQAEKVAAQLHGKLESLFPERQAEQVVIASRAKKPASLEAKMNKRGSSVTLGSIVDTVGARVDVPDLASLQKVSKVLEKAFGEKILARNDYFKHPQANGYRALHYIVEADDRFCEIQVTTHGSRAADLVTHATLYKRELPFQESSHTFLSQASDRASFLDELAALSGLMSLDQQHYGVKLTGETLSPDSLLASTESVHFFEPYLKTWSGSPKPEYELSPQEQKREQELEKAVRHRLDRLGDSRDFYVEMRLVPHLEKVGLDPEEFFLARACWQGRTVKKRRAVLEAVLDQMHLQPEGKKDWKEAVKTARDKGAKIELTDKVFLQYFLENREALRELFQATLPSPWNQETFVTVYRGQLSEISEKRQEEHSVKKLGCYTLSPGIASGFGDTVKEYQVSLDDVWSTAWATQNTFFGEQELTVYTPSGVRPGKIHSRKEKTEQGASSPTL